MREMGAKAIIKGPCFSLTVGVVEGSNGLLVEGAERDLGEKGDLT